MATTERRRMEPARRAAREIIKQYSDIRYEVNRTMHSWSSGDWFGPSLDDHRDAESLFEDRITALIQKHMRRPTPTRKPTP